MARAGELTCAACGHTSDRGLARCRACGRSYCLARETVPHGDGWLYESHFSRHVRLGPCPGERRPGAPLVVTGGGADGGAGGV